MLAILSFIPGFGFFLGAAAVTWGLLSARPKAAWAIGIGAAGCAATIAEGLVLMHYVGERADFGAARADLARKDLNRIATAIEAYETRTGNLPPDLRTLVNPVHGGSAFMNIVDRTGSVFSQHEYRYELLPNGTYVLFAVGPDGIPHTPDDVRPDSVTARVR